MKTLLTLISLSFTSLIWSQSITERYVVPVDTPTNIERYNIDYKLVDESVIATDNSILNLIDLDALDSQRLPDTNVIVHDNTTNLDVILFNKKRSINPNVLHNTTDQ